MPLPTRRHNATASPLLRNKRDLQIKQLQKEIAQLLTSCQEPSARIRVRFLLSSLSPPLNLKWHIQQYTSHTHVVVELFW